MQKKALASTSSSRWPSNQSATQASNVETLQLQGARRSQGACRHLAQISGKIVPLLPCIRNLCDIEGSGYPSQHRLPRLPEAATNGMTTATSCKNSWFCWAKSNLSFWENSKFLGDKSTTTTSSFVVPFTKPNWSHVIAIVPATNGPWTHQVECHRSIRSAGSNHRCRVLALPGITNSHEFPTFAQLLVAKYLIYLDI